jgi:protoporphyrin/coproporphyrin ferrochelatase
MRFKTEPEFKHGQRPKVGVLLVNLGTPDAPTPSAVRRYLAQFLSDPRVVEIPRLVWKPILHGIILRVRPAKSARKYASIWTPQGSPLRVWTEKQATLLTGFLGERGHRLQVRWAMRYGNPSIASQLDALKADGCTRMLVVPLYPQYSGATTASVTDEVYGWARQVRHVPELRVLPHFHDHPAYIEALADSVLAHWHKEGRSEKLLMSFHGMPERTLHLGDPYHCECHKTARLLAQRLGLSQDQYQLSFQSRFGKAKWLEPYTEPTLKQWAKSGIKKVDVVCPAFVSDCIETLEEIAMEGKETFLSHGGQALTYIPCLNDRDKWISALATLCEEQLHGWPTGAGTGPSDAQLEESAQRAKALGAKA